MKQTKFKTILSKLNNNKKEKYNKTKTAHYVYAV